jgi:N-acetylmuramoyl-L-alanine amidase
MKIENKPAVLIAIVLLIGIGYILYQSMIPKVDVVIQAGHEGRTTGNTGAEFKLYREEAWNILVADEIARQLKAWDIDVLRVPAKLSFTRAKIALSIHFDGASTPCASGASIGYPNEKSKRFASRWKKLYSTYFPFKWHQDNFTPNLRNYYGYQWIIAEKFLLLELGEITCETQTRWLKPRLKKIAHLIAYAIATELGKKVPKPDL